MNSLFNCHIVDQRKITSNKLEVKTFPHKNIITYVTSDWHENWHAC